MTELNDVTPLPRLKGEQLLEQLVVDELRRRQRHRGMTLLQPYPLCPVCGQIVDAQHLVLGTSDIDARTLRNDPCGHRLTYNLKTVEQVVGRAQAIADERENRPAGSGAAGAATEATEQATEDSELEALRREVAAARTYAEEMREFCSPHGLSADYAKQLLQRMDRAREGR